MAHIAMKRILQQPGLINGGILGLSINSAFQSTSLILNDYETVRSGKNIRSTKAGEAEFILFRFLNLRRISQHIQPEKLCWEGSSSAVLLKKLEIALKDHQIGEAWEYFKDLKNLYGFPDDGIMDRLIMEMCYSSDPQWLQKASDLVLLMSQKKPVLLKCNVLTKLSISLVRSQMPIPASMILRLMLQRNNLPKLNILWLIFMHMGKTEIGACLSSNILIQICDRFLQLSTEKDRVNLMKPDTMIFNFVLDACVRFKLCLKGHQIIEFMPQIGVVADAHTIVLISQVHDMNGQRDELKKYKSYIDQVSTRYRHHYRVFYDKLLSLHFKFNDIDSASELVFDMCSRYRESLPILKPRDGNKPYLVPIGSQNLKDGLKIQIFPDRFCKDSVLKDDGKEEFVIYKNGKLIFSTVALGKLIVGYRKLGKVAELTKLLLHIQRKLASMEGSNLSSTVVNACIDLDWLETAHDILDDVESAGVQSDLASYKSLLKAYYKGQMYREADALLKQMRNIGVLKTVTEEKLLSASISEITNEKLSSTRENNLVKCLVRETKEKSTNSRVSELNSYNEKSTNSQVSELNSNNLVKCLVQEMKEKSTNSRVSELNSNNLVKCLVQETKEKSTNSLVSELNSNNLVKCLVRETKEKSTNSRVSELNSNNLAKCLVQETKEKSTNSRVSELNSSIYYFCKAKMMGDAVKTYKKMKEMSIKPTEQTYFHLSNGYSSIGMNREITILWGDIKRSMQGGELVVSSDLCEFMLLSFLRGGYFERVMEISAYMKEKKIFADKLMYKSEFSKLHKDLYRSLKASETRNEAQQKRLELVQAFRKWVGVHRII